MNFIFFSILYTLLFRESNSQEVTLYENEYGVFFSPENLTHVKSGTTHTVEWFTTFPGAHHASYKVFDPEVASVDEFEESFNETMADGNATGKGFMVVTATFVGFDIINVTIYDKDNETLGSASLKMSVLLAYEKFNTIFTYILSVLVFILYINMGATIDLAVVKQISKKPVGPAVGVICQYVIMPLIAFGLAKSMFPDDKLLQLGLFLSGTAPGGGSSNMWTLLHGGSLDLSIMMTFVSMIVAFAAVPLWVLTMGPKIIGEDSEFTIPYDSIASIVATLVIPCGIGLLIQRFFPKIAKFLEKKVLAPFSMFNIAFIFTVGAVSHRYIFELLDWRILVAGFCLPFLGYTSGFILAYLARRTWKDIIAISIETGVQNTNIAIIIMKFTLGRPAADLAVVMPAFCTVMTPVPLLLLLLARKLYGRITRSGTKDITSSQDTPKETFENGAQKQPSIKMISNGEVAINEKEHYLPNYGTSCEVIKHHTLYGIDNPAIVEENERV